MTAVGLPVYLTVPQAWLPPGPLIAGRPVPWLAFQALAVIAVACTALTMLTWSRRSPTVTAGERLRLGALMVGGVVFALWAAYGGLLMP